MVDYINKNLEQLAGNEYPTQPVKEAPLPVAPPTATQTFNPSQRLYINSYTTFEGKETFVKELSDYLNQQTPPLYVFINYSQDISTETYLERSQGSRPAGLPDSARYVAFTLVNIPGSVQEQLVVSGKTVNSTQTATKSVKEEMWRMIREAEAGAVMATFFNNGWCFSCDNDLRFHMLRAVSAPAFTGEAGQVLIKSY